jgi:hypothetical protein
MVDYVSTFTGTEVDDYLQFSKTSLEGLSLPSVSSLRLLTASDGDSASVFINGVSYSYVFSSSSSQSDNGVTCISDSSLVGRWQQSSTIFDSIFTVNVPTDFATLELAVQYASKYRPTYIKATGQAQNRIFINIEAGTTITSGIDVRNLDLSYIWIVSEDAIVPVNYDPGVGGWFMYAEKGAVQCSINTIFDMQSIGWDAYYVKWHSEGFIHAGAGFINAAHNNITANSSGRISGREGIFTGAGLNGAQAEKSSWIQLREADVSGATLEGVYALNASTIDARQVNADNCGGHSILAELASTINAFGMSGDSSGGITLRASACSTIEAGQSTLTNSGDSCAFASNVSRINISKATCTNATNSVCLSSSGSTINAENVDGTTAGSVIAAFRVLSGGIVNAHNTFGTISLAAINTIEANGIIFKQT